MHDTVFSLKDLKMPEPTSSTGAAGFAAFKAMGGVAGMAGIGAALASIIVMAMTLPKSPREFVVALISTFAVSAGGGMAVMMYLGLNTWAETGIGLVAMAGVFFAAGLPGWVTVRAFFLWAEKNRNKDIAEMAQEVRKSFRQDA